MAVSTIDPNGLNVGQLGGFKNLIINGDFSVAQRGTSVTPSSGFGYTLDRWQTYSYGSSTTTVSQQSFTAGQTDVPGSPQYFARVAATDTRPYFEQRIENVIPFGGQTVTISLWAKSSDVAALQLDSYSNFGTSGSSTVVDNNGYSLGSLSSTWTKFTHTWTIPSHSGKTINVNNFYAVALTTVSGDIGTVDIALVQLEFGGTATDFEQESYATTLQKCMRYYQKIVAAPASPAQTYCEVCNANQRTTSTSYGVFHHPVPMRQFPTLSYNTLSNLVLYMAGTSNSVSALAYNGFSTTGSGTFLITTSAFGAAGNAGWLRIGSATDYIAFDAEL